MNKDNEKLLKEVAEAEALTALYQDWFDGYRRSYRVRGAMPLGDGCYHHTELIAES